jgi:hypothetical protein
MTPHAISRALHGEPAERTAIGGVDREYSRSSQLFQQFCVQYARGCKHFAALEHAPSPILVSYDSTGFANQEHPRREVPWPEPSFKKTVTATGCDIRKVQRGRAHSPDARDARHHSRKASEIARVIGTAAVWHASVN